MYRSIDLFRNNHSVSSKIFLPIINSDSLSQLTTRDAEICRRGRTYSDSNPLPACYSNHWTPGFSRTDCGLESYGQSFSESIPIISSTRYTATISYQRYSFRRILWHKRIHLYLIFSSVSFSRRNQNWSLLFGHRWGYDYSDPNHGTRTWLGI